MKIVETMKIIHTISQSEEDGISHYYIVKLKPFVVYMIKIRILIFRYIQK